jgi:hypothetical protein
LQTSSTASPLYDRRAAEGVLRDVATELVGTAPMKSRIGEVFSAGFGREDWETAPGPWNAAAAAQAVARCYARPCDPSKSMAVALKVEAALGVRPAPSDEATRTILALSTGWMDVLSSRTRDVSALARDPAFSEIGRALADEAELAPDLMADATVETARQSIASVGTPKQVAAVSAALPELRRIVVSLFRRPRHPGWPGLAAVLLSLQAFKADAEERDDDPLIALRDRLLDVHSDRAALAAAAAMLGTMEHRARAAAVSGMLDDVARCILQSTVLSGRGLEAFGEQLLSEPDLPASGFARIQSSPDLFWPLPADDALGGAGEPGWKGLPNPGRANAPLLEWHRVTTEEDAAADLLFRCGRRALADRVSLQADDLASDTAHVVARGTDPRLLAPAGIALVRRRLVAGRGRFVYEVQIQAVGLGAGEAAFGIENMLLRSIEEATARDLPNLVETHSGTLIDIRCTVSAAAAATSERIARLFPDFSKAGIDLPPHDARRIEEFAAERRSAVLAALGSDAPPKPALETAPPTFVRRAKPVPFLAPPRRGGRTRVLGR